jgi:hypothetical protein
MRRNGLFICLALGLVLGNCTLRGELPETLRSSATPAPLRLFFIAPKRLLWKSGPGVENAENLLKPKPGQALLAEPAPPCKLTAGNTGPAGILLDFGCELQGYVELFTPITPTKDPVRVRVRLGESASEAMAELGGRQNAQNDHALRDQVITLWDQDGAASGWSQPASWSMELLEPAWWSRGVQLISHDDSRAVLEIGSGRYQFRARRR